VNTPPTVALTAPASGAAFTAPATVAIAASASDSDGSVAKVEFFQGATKLGEDASAPYTFSWTNVAAGSYNLTAKATDNAGAVTTSSAVAITVGAAATLPAGWVASDIGAPAIAGSTTYNASNGQWTLSGAGADIWGTTDAFRFARQSITGDVTVSARVISQTKTHDWAKAGVMVRGGTANNAQHAMTVATPARGIAFQRRVGVGGTSTHTAGSTAKAPRWVRVVRAGNAFRGWESADGTTWSAISSAVTIAMPSPALVGLCVTSHNTGAATTAVFEQVTVTPSGGG
jgi:hypothetical protein